MAPRARASPGDLPQTAVSARSLDSMEALALADDDAFRRVVFRALAALRKIFSNQQKNWATLRLRANVGPTTRASEAVAATVLAGASASASASIPDRGAEERAILPWNNKSRAHVSVSVRRFRAGPLEGAMEERQTVEATALPLAKNVPRYTSYIYAASGNAYVQDEVQRRLLFPDHEGEMRVASDEDSDSEGSSSSEMEESESDGGGARARTRDRRRSGG